MGITLAMWSRAGSSGWGCAELQAITGRNEGAKVKEEVGNDAGGTYACFWSPALPTVEGPDSSGSLSPSAVISTQPLSAWWWRRMEDGGKIGRLIEIIMWCTLVTVVSRVP